MQKLLYLPFLTLFFLSNASFAQNLPCLKKPDRISCLNKSVERVAFQIFPRHETIPAHGMHLVMINGQVALLRLSFPRLQYREFCRQFGITFSGKSLHL